MKTIKCPWCSKNQTVNPNGRIKPHQNGPVQCPGSGQHGLIVTKLNDLIEEAVAKKRK
jgi:hypothetical protein